MKLIYNIGRKSAAEMPLFLCEKLKHPKTEKENKKLCVEKRDI